MRLNNAAKPFAIALAVLALFALVGVMTFAGPCVHDDGSFSVCHDAFLGIAAGSVVALVIGIACLFVANSRVAGVVLVLGACAGLFVAAAPGAVFPLCMMDTMRCHLIMQPFSQVLGILMAATAAIGAIRSLRAR